MEVVAPALSIRQRLLWLFGLLLATGATVLVLDEINQRGTIRTLSSLRDDALSGLRNVKAVSDAYGLDLVDATLRVRSQLMGWDQGVEKVDRATQRIQEEWQKLLDTHMPAEQRSLLEQIGRTRETADRAAAKLRAILKAQDTAGLARFADTELYPAIDPVTARLEFLSDLMMIAARQRLDDDAARNTTISAWRIGLSLAAFLIVAVVGRRTLRHIYRGVEKLVQLANAMRRGDYDAQAGMPLKGELGEVAAAFLDMRETLARNDGELRESEARAQEANRAKSAFLAAMSHEIRTPMIGVTGMLELLSHTTLDAEQRYCVDVIENSAQSLLEIIGDILDFSKIEAGRLEIAPEPCDLRRLIENTVNNFLGVASAKGLTLDLAIDADVGAAHRLDPLRLRQVLSNLLSNALKFTNKGGVRVEVERLRAVEGGETIAIRVHDTGIGIAQDQQDKLFAPFSQAESGTARQYGGTGLGLAICRRLTELMGGELALRSRLGEGSTMSVVLQLPLVDPSLVVHEVAAAPDDYPRRPTPDIATAEQERSLVLLVDDHPTNRDVVARQLARAGYACETSPDGEDALERWQSGRYALVLADIHMPRLDGYGLVAAIRRAERQSSRGRTPVIALTANVTKGEAERCLAAGMDDFLPKPIGIALLARKLRQWLPHVAFPSGAAGAAPLRTPALPPATDTVSAANVVDSGVLLDIAGGDRRVAAQLLADFLESTRRDLAALQAAQARADHDAASREAHRIKGAAKLVGARELGHLAAAAEASARTRDTAGLGAHLEPLRAALERLERYQRTAAGGA